MSYRGANLTAVDILRNYKDELDRLKLDQGTTKQNTIRLGNWVLEAEADELVKMTNLITGVVSYVGANADTTVVEGGGAYVEIPPFSFGGLIRNSFGTVNMRSNTYTMPVDFTSTTMSITLANAAEEGIVFDLYQNDVVAYTSPTITADIKIEDLDLEFLTDDALYVEITEDGSGFNAGLSVMLRL